MISYFVDSNCDISRKEALDLGFKFISMPYIVDGKEIFPYEDFDEFDAHEFYEMLRNTNEIPKTSAISPSKYISYFEEEFKKGNDICYFYFSSKMSSTFNSMYIALNELKEKYSNKFYEVDLKAITVLARVLIEEIAVLKEQTKDIDELIKKVNEELIPHYSLISFASDLKFFQKSGRLNNSQAFFGSLIKIKPIIAIDDEGIMKAIDKEVGKKNAIKRLVKEITLLGDEIYSHPLFICNSDAKALVDELIKELKETFKEELNIKIIDINPTSGIHSGPSCVGVGFHSKRRIL